MASGNHLPSTQNPAILEQENVESDSSNLSQDQTPNTKSDRNSECAARVDFESKEQKDSKISKKTKRKQRIILNVSNTKYEIVRYVGKKIFQWRLSEETDGEWDVFWTDCAVNPETLAKMHPYQKINHFPGMYSLARKNHLGKHLMRMRRAFPDQYKFFPQTYLLPAEYNEFRAQCLKTTSTYIVKPEAGCQGRGIFLTRTCDNVQPGEHYVIQKYLTKPFLMEGLKFDMRVYILLAGCDPLRIYIYNDGLARFATEQYIQPSGKNLDNMCMHLTNYAINKGNSKFVFNTSEENDGEGHKRSLKAVFKSLEDQGYDVKKLWSEIKKLAIKTFISVQPILAHNYRSCQPDEPYNNMCFEILGFDVMLDEKLRPYLLEVNHTPSFTTDTPLDRNIKKNVIKDTLKLMNVSLEERLNYKKKKRVELRKRILTGKSIKISLDERKVETEKAQKARDLWESENLGDYEKVFPLENPSQNDEDYDSLLKEANNWWETWTGTSNKKNAKRSLPEVTKLLPATFASKSPISRGDRQNKIQNSSTDKSNYQLNNSRSDSILDKPNNFPVMSKNIQLNKHDQHLLLTSDDTNEFKPNWNSNQNIYNLSLDNSIEEEQKHKSHNATCHLDTIEKNRDHVRIIEEEFKRGDNMIQAEDTDSEKDYNFLQERRYKEVPVLQNDSWEANDDDQVKQHFTYTEDAKYNNCLQRPVSQNRNPSLQDRFSKFSLNTTKTADINIGSESYRIKRYDNLMDIMGISKNSTNLTSKSNDATQKHSTTTDEVIQIIDKSAPQSQNFMKVGNSGESGNRMRRLSGSNQQKPNIVQQKSAPKILHRPNPSLLEAQNNRPQLYNYVVPKVVHLNAFMQDIGDNQKDLNLTLGVQSYRPTVKSFVKKEIVVGKVLGVANHRANGRIKSAKKMLPNVHVPKHKG